MTSTPNRCSSMTTSLPSSPEPSSKTRVACALLGVPIETMRGSYHAHLSADHCRPAGTDQYGEMLSAFMSWPGNHIGGALGSAVPVSLFFATAPIQICLHWLTPFCLHDGSVFAAVRRWP